MKSSSNMVIPDKDETRPPNMVVVAIFTAAA
jgi:hypothetical protein